MVSRPDDTGIAVEGGPVNSEITVAHSLAAHRIPHPVADWLARLDRRVWELENAANAAADGGDASRRYSSKVERGLREILPFLRSQIEAGEESDLGAHSNIDDVNAAVDWIAAEVARRGAKRRSR